MLVVAVNPIKVFNYSRTILRPISKQFRVICSMSCFLKANFWRNPQFLVTLTDVDHDDDENLATVIIALMQKDSRLKRIKARSESAEEFIQFRLFKVFS